MRDLKKPNGHRGYDILTIENPEQAKELLALEKMRVERGLLQLLSDNRRCER